MRFHRTIVAVLVLSFIAGSVFAGGASQNPRVSGVVSNLDTATKKFTLTAAVSGKVIPVSYSMAKVTGDLADGKTVSVEYSESAAARSRVLGALSVTVR